MDGAKFPISILRDYALRPYVESDAFSLFQTIQKNREFFKKTMGWLDYSITENDSLNYIRKVNEGNIKGTNLIFGIFKNDKVIGNVGFNEISIENESNLKYGIVGYWLDQGMNGKGIITESVRSVLNIAIDLGIEKFILFCSKTNIKSRNVAERLGFHFVRELKDHEDLYGIKVDNLLYELISRKDYDFR